MFVVCFYEFIIAGLLQSDEFFIEQDARPSICCCVAFLFFRQDVSLPVGESFSFADAHAEEVGIDLLQTHVFHADFFDSILKVDEMSWFKFANLMEHHHVVVERQPYLGYCSIFQQTLDGWRI